MRGSQTLELINTFPPELRDNKTSHVHQAIRKKILTGEYDTNQEIIPKDVEIEYHVNNNSVQIILLRLASEGLIKILPIKKRKRPNNAAYNEYRVADFNIRHRILSTRQGGFVSDISRETKTAYLEKQKLEIQNIDKEVASLLELAPNEKIVFYRSLQKSDEETIIAISDTYLPFWFAEKIPELDSPNADIYQLMIQLGKTPTWCTETVDVVQASSVERKEFKLSPDDPAALFKITRRVFDQTGHPLCVDFLTDRGDTYRLHYSFPLFASGIPEHFKKK